MYTDKKSDEASPFWILFIINMRKSCKPWTVRHFQNIFMLKVLFLFEAVKFILF